MNHKRATINHESADKATVSAFLSGKFKPTYDSLPTSVRIVARSFTFEGDRPRKIRAIAGKGPVTYNHEVRGPVTQLKLQNLADNAAKALDRTKEPSTA